jgi:hypothetical protein
MYKRSALMRTIPITCGVGIKSEPLVLGEKMGHLVGNKNSPHCNLVMPVSPLLVGFPRKEKVKSAAHARELAAGADLCGVSAWWISPFPMDSKIPRTGRGRRNWYLRRIRWLQPTQRCDLYVAEAQTMPAATPRWRKMSSRISSRRTWTSCTFAEVVDITLPSA